MRRHPRERGRDVMLRLQARIGQPRPTVVLPGWGCFHAPCKSLARDAVQRAKTLCITGRLSRVQNPSQSSIHFAGHAVHHCSASSRAAPGRSGHTRDCADPHPRRPLGTYPVDIVSAGDGERGAMLKFTLSSRMRCSTFQWCNADPGPRAKEIEVPCLHSITACRSAHGMTIKSGAACTLNLTPRAASARKHRRTLRHRSRYLRPKYSLSSDAKCH